jgi:phage-related protein
MNQKEYFDFTSSMNDGAAKITGFCSDMKSAINVKNITNTIDNGLQSASSTLNNTLVAGFSPVKNTITIAGDGITSFTDKIGETLSNTLKVLGQGIDGGFSFLNDSLLGGLGQLDSFDVNAANPTEAFRVNSAQQFLILLKDNIKKAETILGNIQTASTSQIASIDLNASDVSAKKAEIQAAIDSITKAITALKDALPTLTTQLAEVTTNANKVDLQTVLNAVKQEKLNVTDFNKAMANINDGVISILTDPINLFMNTVGSYQSGLSKALYVFATGTVGTSALANKTDIQNYMNQVGAIDAQLSGLQVLAGQIKLNFNDFTTSMKPVTESFAFVDPSTLPATSQTSGDPKLPFVHTKHEVPGANPIDVFSFTTLPVQMLSSVNPDGSPTQFYQMDKIQYYIQKANDGTIIEYVQHPIPGKEDFQLYVFTLPNEKEPMAFSNYDIPGANKTQMDAFLQQYQGAAQVYDIANVQDLTRKREGFSILKQIQDGVTQYVVDPVKSGFETAVSTVESSIAYIMTPIKAFARAIFAGIKCIGTQIQNIIQQAADIPIQIGKLVSTTFTGLTTAASTVVNEVTSTVSTLVKQIGKIGSSVFNGVKDAVSGTISYWSKIVSGLITTVTIIKNKIIELLRWIAALPGKIGDSLRNVWRSISGYAESMYSKVTTSITSAFGFDPEKPGLTSEEATRFQKTMDTFSLILKAGREYNALCIAKVNALGATPDAAKATLYGITLPAAMTAVLTETNKQVSLLNKIVLDMENNYDSGSFSSRMKALEDASSAALKTLVENLKTKTTDAGDADLVAKVSEIETLVGKIKTSEGFAFLDGSKWYKNKWFILAVLILLLVVAYFLYKRRQTKRVY